MLMNIEKVGLDSNPNLYVFFFRKCTHPDILYYSHTNARFGKLENPHTKKYQIMKKFITSKHFIKQVFQDSLSFYQSEN